MRKRNNTPVILLGAGGHARTLVEGLNITGYIDPFKSKWLDKVRFPEDYDLSHDTVVIGFVGMNCEALYRRYQKMAEYIVSGINVATVIHPTAVVSPSAVLQTGVQVLPRAVINSGAFVKSGVVVNSGAIIEHDAVIMEGCHIAPGAIVLGGAFVDRYCFIGANATVVQGRSMPERTFVKAGTVYK